MTAMPLRPTMAREWWPEWNTSQRLASIIRYALAIAKYTTADLTVLLNCSIVRARHVYCGRRDITVPELFKIAAAVGVQPTELLEGVLTGQYPFVPDPELG